MCCIICGQKGMREYTCVIGDMRATFCERHFDRNTNCDICIAVDSRIPVSVSVPMRR